MSSPPLVRRIWFPVTTKHIDVMQLRYEENTDWYTPTMRKSKQSFRARDVLFFSPLSFSFSILNHSPISTNIWKQKIWILCYLTMFVNLLDCILLDQECRLLLVQQWQKQHWWSSSLLWSTQGPECFPSSCLQLPDFFFKFWKKDNYLQRDE